MKAFADLYRRLDSATSTRAKQAAMVEAFSAGRADPAQWASAAWMVYFLAGGKPRQTVPTRVLWRLAVEGAGYPEWLCAECYGAVGDLAETLTLILPEGGAGEEVSLDEWMRERLLLIPTLAEEEKYARLRRWVDALPTDQRFAFFKLITGELRVGVSRLQVVKALSEVAGVEESRMAQRMIGYAQARRAPTAPDFEGLIAEVDRAKNSATIYTDGVKTASGALALDEKASLSNSSDLLVGKNASGHAFAGTLGFLRITRGTLADSRTTIEELYDWEFDGPFLRDLRGHEVTGASRDAGALEFSSER